MFTYTGSIAYAKQLTNNSNTTSFDSVFSTMLQQYDNETVHAIPSIFTERTNNTSIVTYPSQQFYELPNNVRRIITLSVLVSGTSSVASSGFNWQPEECPTMERWITINMNQNITSDNPQYYFFYNGQVGLYPTPASGYNQMTIRYQQEATNFSQADYTTGTITTVPYTTTLTGSPANAAVSATLSGNWTIAPTGTYEMVFNSGAKRLVTLTNGATTVTWTNALTAAETSSTVTINTSNSGSIIVGSSTTWTTAMQGYYLQVTPSIGDGIWYLIDTVYSTTALSLRKQYQGTAISSGSATYTIGQTSLIPEAYQVIPIYRTVAQYYTTISPDSDRRNNFSEQADRNFRQMMIDFGNKTTDPTVHDDFGKSLINPNLAVNITGSTTSQ